ncbi:MAG: GlsB/YeaQ/YmgE family stress response membrane protein [Nocardioidaceae bacterium]
MIGTIIGLIIIGLIAGFIARALVPGRQSMSILETLILGIVGSFVGGFLGRLLFHHGSGFIQTSSWIGSIIGAVIVLLIYMQFRARSHA